MTRRKIGAEQSSLAGRLSANCQFPSILADTENDKVLQLLFSDHRCSVLIPARLLTARRLILSYPDLNLHSVMPLTRSKYTRLVTCSRMHLNKYRSHLGILFIVSIDDAGIDRVPGNYSIPMTVSMGNINVGLVGLFT